MSGDVFQRTLVILDQARTDDYRAAERLYCDSFADEERVPFDELWQWVTTPSLPLRGLMLALRLGNAVAGIAVLAYFVAEELGYLAYLAISPREQGKGHGRWLYNRVLEEIDAIAKSQHRRSPSLTFWEVRDPAEATTEEERRLRERRIAFYQRLGADILPIEYLCPPVAPDQPAVPYLVMIRTYPPGRVIDRATALDVALTGLVKCNDAPKDSEYVRMALGSIDEHWFPQPQPR